MIGRPITLLLPPDRAGEEDQILARIARGERVHHFETVRLRKDGRRIDISLTISPVKNQEGKVIGASHIARDIAGRVEYGRLTGLLAAIVESADDAVVGKDLSGVIRTWNHGARKLYGYSHEEALGRSMTMLLPSGREDEEAAILARIAKGERVEHFETERLRSDGERINVSITISPIRNGGGEVIGASHVARNITDRNRLESATAHLAAIVESSDDAIVSKNLDGRILTWNSGAERIYGYPAAEVMGRPMSLLLPPDRPDEEAEILDRLKRGARVDHFETVRVRKDGRMIDVSLSISPIRDADGDVRGASHVARDISDRKILESKLLKAQKLESLGVLAGGVAHDFNNLLVGILGNASLLAEALQPSNPNRRLAEDCVRAAERAAQLTRQLLAYAGKGRFVTETVSLSDLVSEIANLIQTSIPRKVQVRLDLDPNIPLIEADSGQLQQVIMNLVINGAEAIGDQTGLVIVTTGVQDVDEHYIETIWGSPDLKPGRYITLEVNDSGCGMDQQTLEKIFDPFFTTKFTGRGLGLAAVSGIIRGHKGALKVYTAPGKGSTFRVFFPVADTLAAHTRPSGATALQGIGTILVVDDEETVRDTARNTLERYGYQVLLAREGREAVELFREAPEKISMVLLDLTMPVMGGEQALRELQRIHPSVRVLLSSGFNEVEAVRRFTGKGLAGFVQKPYTAVALAAKVKLILATAIQ